ncbi:MAG: hypothetical protein NZ772_01965 [Cyanobacteria bacterium]|nr:hypothetical protein [Cyanobacteriota bacterium]MDW8201181.1 hypothetical protein [Cyanobacteriota bacterium SKYGB_h_bin112]
MAYSPITPPLRSNPRSRTVGLVTAITLSMLLSIGTIGLVGCNQLAKIGVGTTPIEKIVSNPSKYTEVTVRGKVVNRIGILGRGAYEVKDNSGSVWVISGAGDLPAVDATVTVKGTVSQGVSIGDKNLAITITEKQRL